MIDVPSWVNDAIFYQIFPDRFSNGDRSNDPPNVQPWDSPPTFHGFKGGDLRGIIEKFDYLTDLGINAIYLNPIFQATSNHRYNATDYFRVDPKLGHQTDFQELCDVAHSNGVKIILDGVFNHCGRGFFGFNDLLENQENSPYQNWFHVKNIPVDAYSPGEARDYLGWWNLKSLPKFNTTNPETRNYLLAAARYWIEAGADGWRLDVPNEIDDDSFWAEFRQVVKSANPEAYLLGEIWESDPRWTDQNHFDGLMNYPLRKLILELIGEHGTMSTFIKAVEDLCRLYPVNNFRAMYNLLGSHDTERVMTLLKADVQKVKMAFFLIFSLPGIPAIYYGDEVGLAGGRDPDCRRTFPWDRMQWNEDLRTWVKKLITSRRQLTALSRGGFERLYVNDRRRVGAFVRQDDQSLAVVVVNASSSGRTVMLPVDGLGWQDGSIHRDVLSGGSWTASQGVVNLALAPFSGIWLA